MGTQLKVNRFAVVRKFDRTSSTISVEIGNTHLMETGTVFGLTPSACIVREK
jgi:hypothetical protein